MMKQFDIIKKRQVNNKGVSLFYMPLFVVFIYVVLIVALILAGYFVFYRSPTSTFNPTFTSTNPDFAFSSDALLDQKLQYDDFSKAYFEEIYYNSQGLPTVISIQNYNNNYGKIVDHSNLRGLTYKEAIIKLSPQAFFLFYMTQNSIYFVTTELVQGTDCFPKFIHGDNFNNILEVSVCSVKIEENTFQKVMKNLNKKVE